MSKPLLTGARRFSASVSIAATLAALTAGSAVAAGTPYGIAPKSGMAPGFSAVVIAKTLGNKGGAVSGGGVGGEVTVKVPPGAAGKSLLIAITHGSASTVKDDLRGALRDYKILATFGIELRHGSSPATARKPLTVDFGAKDIRRGEVVVAYNSKTRKFAPVAASFSIRFGGFNLTIKSSESLALLGPKK